MNKSQVNYANQSHLKEHMEHTTNEIAIEAADQDTDSEVASEFEEMQETCDVELLRMAWRHVRQVPKSLLGRY